MKKTVVQNAIESIVSDKQEARNWLEAIGEGSWDATTALALSHLPRLQHLHLVIIGEHNHYTGCQGAYQGETYHWIKETLMRAAQLQQQGISTPLALEHLTAVTLIPSQEKNRNLSMSQLLPFLKLKSMRKLVARGWDLLRWEVEVDTNFTIVDMELQRFNVAESLVERFFACFPVLEKLHCEYCYSKAFNQPGPVVLNSLSCALILPRALPGAEIHYLVPGVDLLPRFIRHLNMRDAAKATLWHIMNLLSRKVCVSDPRIVKIVFVQPLL